MTRRAPVAVEDTSAYVAVMPSTTPVAAELAQEVAIERAEEAQEAQEAQEEDDAIGQQSAR